MEKVKINIKFNSMINRVTFTGADDTTDINEMIELSEKYPFVEWAILVMPGRYGKDRFPSKDWIRQLVILAAKKVNLSLHLCGKYVNDILVGDDLKVMADVGASFLYFNRIQINTHGLATFFSEHLMLGLMKSYESKELIFQYDDVNTAIYAAANAGVNCSALFDLSHGAGILPDQWPDLLPNIKCGYAGGLGPDNLVDQIKAIEEKAGDTPIWIDMETKVRTDREDLGISIFDLGKVEQCLQLAAPFIR